MNLPNLALLHHYGNEEVLLEKAAGGEALAARTAIGLFEALRSSRGRDEQRMQAHQMNEAFRELLARQARPAREAMRHTRAPMVLAAGRPQPMMGVPMGYAGDDIPLGMDEGMVRMASAIGADLLRVVPELEKDAGIGSVMGAGMKGLGAGLTNVSSQLKSMTSGFGATKRFTDAAKSMGMGPAPAPGMFAQAKGMASNLAQKVTPGGRANARMQSAGQLHEATKGLPGNVAQAATGAAGTGAQAAGAAAAGEVGGLGKAWQRTGLSNGAWKSKLPMLAAGGLAAYGLYAGAKKGFEVLGREAEPQQYNAGGANPAYGVNQYGVPDRNTPFMT